MTWFETLTGFSETSPDFVRANFVLKDQHLTSLANHRSFYAGEFETPTLRTLRGKEVAYSTTGPIQLSEVIADVQSLHQDSQNADSVFQVASQFNCLEMAAPQIIPEDGVGRYQNDPTQGPACCICAGAGTIFRNYFVEHRGQFGQTSENQIDCLEGVAQHFNNSSRHFWQMQNGYCFPNKDGLSELELQLSGYSEIQLDAIREKLMVGVQSDTEVTIGKSPHRVTQVFCSALPIAYSKIRLDHWDYFPRLILDATYESTFHVAFQNLLKTGCSNLYLTLVGGGVFGNKIDWILSAITRSMKLFADSGLNVKIVSYGRSKPEVAEMVRQHNSV